MDLEYIESLTVDDIKPVAVSFKKTEDELVLYKWILKKSGKSGFIKDILREIKDAEKNEKSNKVLDPLSPLPNKNENKNNNLIQLDF